MSLYITEDCINCGACDEICPTNAICVDEENSVRKIIPERCTECVGFYERTMCQVECPVECCVSSPEFQEDEDTLFVKARDLFQDHEFANPPPSHFSK